MTVARSELDPAVAGAERSRLLAAALRSLVRLGELFVLLLLLSLLLFALFEHMPGSAEDEILAGNPELSWADVQAIRAARGLDRPLWTRYRCWLLGRGEAAAGADASCGFWPSQRGLLGGDLGHSALHHRPVAELLRERVPRTLSLTVPAFLLALLFSIALGARAALVPGGAFEHALALGSSAGLALPPHWLGMLFVALFAAWAGWFPPGGVEDPDGPGLLSRVHHAALPVLVLALLFTARFARLVQAGLQEALASDFVLFARAKGESRRGALLRHALPTALFPLVAAAAQSVPALFSGSLVVESVFSYPGVGVLIAESREARDHLVSVVVLLCYAALALSSGWLAEVAARLLDPRIREGG